MKLIRLNCYLNEVERGCFFYLIKASYGNINHFHILQTKSSHRRCSVKKGVLRNFTGNVAGLRPGTLFKKRVWRRCFPMNFAKFLRKSFLQNTSGQLLLKINDSKQRNQAKIRSSRSKMFFKISVLENFAIFTGKHLCWSLFLIKL